MALNSIHKKVGGSSAGKNAKFKKDGYAAGRVPDVVIGTKAGHVPGQPYSGPPVAHAPRNG